VTLARQTGRTCLLLLLNGGLALLAFPQSSQQTSPPAPPAARKSSAKASLPQINLSLIVLDAAHGGEDAGAHLADGTLEKDQTMAFVLRLRPLLEARGFTVILTRQPSPTPSPDAGSAAPAPSPTEDQRAEQANRSHPLACLMVHATSAGHGVHLFTSALTPPIDRDSTDLANTVPQWNEAQASRVPQSLRLANALSTTLNGVRIPLVAGRASVPPIDSLTCAAVAVELAPLPQMAGRTAPASDPDYQARVAQAIAAGLAGWRSQEQAEIAHALAAAEAAAAKTAQPATKKPAPKPKPTPPDIPGDGQ
jgi:N-acetylmuramoyl-L-alanine amidase